MEKVATKTKKDLGLPGGNSSSTILPIEAIQLEKMFENNPLARVIREAELQEAARLKSAKPKPKTRPKSPAFYDGLLGVHSHLVAEESEPLKKELKRVLADTSVKKTIVRHTRNIEETSKNYLDTLIEIEKQRITRSQTIIQSLSGKDIAWKKVQTDILNIDLQKLESLRSGDPKTGVEILQGLLKDALLNIIALRNSGIASNYKMAKAQHRAALIINGIRTLTIYSSIQQVGLDK